MTETANFSRLIGEKDVLAAITCEYLSETVSKKDTSSATVSLGKVRMTTYRFQFVPNPHEYPRVKQHLLNRPDEEIESFFLIPLGAIAAVKKKNSVIELFTKDLRVLSFRFDIIEVTQIYTVLTTYVFPNKTDFLFAFYHRLSEDFVNEEKLLPCSDGWNVYDAKAEWKRQGVFENGRWRITMCNEGFQAIDTYPNLLVVPSCISDEVSIQVGAIGCTRVPLARQNSCFVLDQQSERVDFDKVKPTQGMSKATSPADESLVAGIASSSLLNDALHIIDCRPMTNALANRAKGYGVESTVNYKNCDISFMNIPNIHSMRDSMKKLRTLCSSATCDNLQWLGNIEDTKWLVYIRHLLKAALHIATLLRDGESVLLHCSHGWDRTSQLSALAQLFLDPYYRTWEGFQVLIEKEWLEFGHPFHMRSSHGEKADTQESPIFIQFLDCVWQLVRVYPTYFEFNEGLLLLLADALHSCRFGTFLFDCKKQRYEADLENRTTSVWTWVNGFRLQLTEPSYIPNQQLHPPLTGLLKCVHLWESLFLRWSGQPLLHEPPIATNFFADNNQRILTWQLPQGAMNALNTALAHKYKEAQLVLQLQERIAALEQQLSER